MKPFEVVDGGARGGLDVDAADATLPFKRVCPEPLQAGDDLGYRQVCHHRSLHCLPRCSTLARRRARRPGLTLATGPALPSEFVHEVVTGHTRDSKDDLARTGSVELLIARPDQGEVEDEGLGEPRFAGIAGSHHERARS